MKKVIRLMLTVLAFWVGALLPIHGAVTVQTITASEFGTLTSTNTAAWSVVYRGGGTSGAGSDEIRLTRYRDQGNQTLTGHVTWSSTNSLEVLVSNSGYLSARANSITITNLEFAVTRPFNQILIFMYDEALFGSVNEFKNIGINGNSVNNMFADGNGFPGNSDIVSISNFGSQAPFSLNGAWSPGMFPTGDEQYVSIFAINNTSIPEPSITLLIGLASSLMLRRRR